MFLFKHSASWYGRNEYSFLWEWYSMRTTCYGRKQIHTCVRMIWKFLSAKFHVQAVSIRIQKYIPDCFLLHKSQMSFRRSLSYFDNARFQWLLLIYQLLNICRSKYAGIASSSNFSISVIACLMILGGTAPFSEGPEVATRSARTWPTIARRDCLYCHPVDLNKQAALR